MVKQFSQVSWGIVKFTLQKHTQKNKGLDGYFQSINYYCSMTSQEFLIIILLCNTYKYKNTVLLLAEGTCSANSGGTLTV